VIQVPELAPSAGAPDESPPSAGALAVSKTSPSEEPADICPPTLSLIPENTWSKRSLAVKAGLAGALVLASVGILLLTLPAHQPESPAARAKDPWVPLAIGQTGWINDFSSSHDPSGWLPRLSVLRGSLNLTDFRLELQGQIENKAFGWVFRARDSKNYYVTKIEVVKPGLNPTAALKRFAVIDGQEQPRAQIPLSIPVRPDTIYQIRLEARGTSFSTWVQGEKVDQWIEPELSSGGLGLYSERRERGTLIGTVAVFVPTGR
jgi:hypothetical protein